jgi:hypothetical protein
MTEHERGNDIRYYKNSSGNVVLQCNVGPIALLTAMRCYTHLSRTARIASDSMHFDKLLWQLLQRAAAMIILSLLTSAVHLHIK